MIPKECKRLAEVDFPIAVVSRYSAKEKSIRYGHPSTFHLWWARRPLAACRTMLMALLLPDPADPNCPVEFKQRAREILPRLQGRPGDSDKELRESLFRFIGNLSIWEKGTNLLYLDAARNLIKAAHVDEAPLVVDPFGGGGSIPLEAIRLGCDAFASDSNPVAFLLLKTVLEEIPRCETELQRELLAASDAIVKALGESVASLYPTEKDGSNPIAFLWARTIVCDSCGADIPLLRSFWLSKK